MLFKDNLYSIVRQDIAEDVATFGLLLDADSVIYKAHFPSKPVTPGVCLIQIAEELFSISRAERFEIERVKNVKFVSLLDPIASPEIEVEISCVVPAGEGEYKSSIVFRSNETIFSKMSLIFKTKEKLIVKTNK